VLARVVVLGDAQHDVGEGVDQLIGGQVGRRTERGLEDRGAGHRGQEVDRGVG
jgi:hypothetical protein